MPKITRHGGASDRHAAEPQAPAAEGSEQPSAGISSETSPEKSSSKSETNASVPRKPARKTASRSGKARTTGSSARSADGGPEDGTSETDSADA